jgi:SAM-dependent methyltransferase
MHEDWREQVAGKERIVPGSVPDSCLVCAAPQPQKLFFRNGKWFWSCKRCDFVFVHDIYPEFLQDVDHLKDAEFYAFYAEAKPRQRRENARLFERVEADRVRNRLLEIGCSGGGFLRCAKEAGWDCTGVEILPEMARLAREKHGLDVRVGDLFAAGFADGEFDVVYMNEVIEHIVEPIPLMIEVRRVLRAGGVVVVRTGNARSWSARLRGREWFYWSYDTWGHGHIRFYGPKAAAALAKAAGFASVVCDTHGFAFLEAPEMRTAWLKPLTKLAQGLVSPVARLCGAGHRLTMWFRA